MPQASRKKPPSLREGDSLARKISGYLLPLALAGCLTLETSPAEDAGGDTIATDLGPVDASSDAVAPDGAPDAEVPDVADDSDTTDPDISSEDAALDVDSGDITNPDTPEVPVDEPSSGDADADELEPCVDPDNDARGPGCIAGDDCAPADPDHWSDCSACFDPDGDDRGTGCNRGSDCDNDSALHWSDCGFCEDDDGDGRGVSCNLGADCEEGQGYSWADCGFCIDHDIDGFGEDCDVGPDCNDDDPWVHPLGFDLPYDGLDQDCDGSDLVPTNENGVFGDSREATSGTGTMESPLNAIDAGLALAQESGRRYVFMTAGVNATPVSLPVGIQLIGGFTDGFESWDPENTSTSVGLAPNSEEPTVGILTTPVPPTHVLSALAGLQVVAPAVDGSCRAIELDAPSDVDPVGITVAVVRNRIEGPSSCTGVGGAVLIQDAGPGFQLQGNTIASGLAASSQAVWVQRGRLLMADNFATANGDSSSTAVVMQGRLTAILVNNVIEASGDGGTPFTIEGSLDANVLMMNNIIQRSSSGSAGVTYDDAFVIFTNNAIIGGYLSVTDVDAEVTLSHNAFEEGTVFLAHPSSTENEIGELNDCDWPGCRHAAFNFAVDDFGLNPSNPGHINANSLLRYQGLVLSEGLYIGAGYALRDIDGETRSPAIAWDVGPDDYPDE